MFLLNTNVVIELRKAKPHSGVLAWLQATAESDLFISAVTLGKMQRGIELTRDQNVTGALEISQWADRLSNAYNILPMDTAIFRRWAKMAVIAAPDPQSMPLDCMDPGSRPG